MSMSYNMKQNLEQVFHSCRIHPSSPSISLFYLTNPNPTEEDIAKFTEEYQISTEVVLKYFNEMKEKNMRLQNLSNLRYGSKYLPPSENERKNYYKKLDGDSEMNFDFGDFTIQKKPKKPEFHVVSNTTPAKDDNFLTAVPNPSPNMPAPSFSYSTTTSPLEVPSGNFEKGIDDPKQLPGFISSMKRDNKLDQRLAKSSHFGKISNNCLQRFLQLKGVIILADWVHDCKDIIESSTERQKKEKKVYELILNILNLCERLPISVNDLKAAKIGKQINKFGKCLDEYDGGFIKKRCEDIVRKWKRLIEVIKETESKSSKSEKNNVSNSNEEDLSPRTISYLNKKLKRDDEIENVQEGFQSSSVPASQSLLQEKNYKKSRMEPSEEKDRDRGISNLPQTKRSTVHADGSKPFHHPNNSNKNTNASLSIPSSVSLNAIKTIKGGIKKNDSNSSNKKKIRVKFESDIKLERIKIFKLTDEPIAPAVTEEEYQKIQQEIAMNPQIFKIEDIRMKEVKMEKPRVAQMDWKPPYELKFNDTDENKDPRACDSKEKGIIDQFCQKVLSVTYFKDIPEPKEGEKKLFSYDDPEIPKIENMKKNFNPDKPAANSINEILDYINSLTDSSINAELIYQIHSKIEKIKDITPEEKGHITSFLSSHLHPTGPIPNNIPNIPNNPQIPPQFSFNNVNMNINSNPPNPFNYYNNSLNMPAMSLNNPLNNYLNKPKLPVQEGKRPMGSFEQYNNKVESKMNIGKYRTRPCRNYHSSVGCNRGDTCHFIHDSNFQGREIPHFSGNNLREKDKRLVITNVNIVNNYVSDKEKEGEGDKDSNVKEEAGIGMAPNVMNSQNMRPGYYHNYIRPNMPPMNMNMPQTLHPGFPPQGMMQHPNFIYMNPFFRPGMGMINQNQNQSTNMGSNSDNR